MLTQLILTLFSLGVINISFLETVSPLNQTEFTKPAQFKLCSSFITFQHILRPQKKFEIINFEWSNTKLLELIFVVSLDCRSDIFSYSLAVVYRAKLLI